jgi:hypothetical protein
MSQGRGRARTNRALAAVVAAALAAVVTGAAWLPAPVARAEDRNLVAARNGAQVIKYTSERGGEWRAAKLIDEQITPAGWASADESMPQEIIVRLPALSRFNTLVFDLTSDVPESKWARDVAIYTADPFPTIGGWKLVARIQLARQPGEQRFTVEPVDGRFIRLVITSAQSPDAPRVSLNEVKVFMR